jgi:hypothetical protein
MVFSKRSSVQVLWNALVIPVFWKLKEEDCEFEASLV